MEGLPFSYPLTYQFLQMVQGSLAIVPIPGEAVVKQYINGDARKRYDFALQAAFMVSDDLGTTANTDNMLTMRQWQDWIDEQQRLKNYPDFGDKCSNYELANLANMPMMAGRQDDGMAKYQFTATLYYLEVR